MESLMRVIMEDAEREDSRSYLGDGLFAEAASEFDQLYKSATVNLMKLQAYTESVERELNIQYAQAELKVLKENGTSDDLAYLEDAAEEGAIGKLKKIIEKAIEWWKEMITNLKSKVLSKIASSESRKVISSVEKKVKLNPILARKKVKIIDKKKPLGVIEKYKKVADKASAKAAKGLLGEREMKTLSSNVEEFRSEFKNSIAGTAALTTVKVSALVSTLSSEIDKLPALVDTIDQQHTSILEKLKAVVSSDTAATAQAATNVCVNFRNKLAQQEVNEHIDSIMNMMNVLKKEVLHAKGNTEVKPVQESADDDFISSLEELFK